MIAYQYSILRYRRSKSAGELVNIGLLMTVPDQGDVFHFVTPRYGRLSKFFGDFEGTGYRRMVDDLRSRLKETLSSDEAVPRQLHLKESYVTRHLSSPELQLLKDELISDPESCFQWSEIMSGVHPRPSERFEQLCEEFILQHEPGREKRERRDEKVIQREVKTFLSRVDYRDRLDFGKRLQGRHDVEHEFLVGWKNGKVQVLDALSFDYLDKQGIERKANQWCGLLTNLAADGHDFQFTGVVAPPPKKELYGAYDNACALVDDMEQTRSLVEEDDLNELDREIARDLR